MKSLEHQSRLGKCRYRGHSGSALRRPHEHEGGFLGGLERGRIGLGRLNGLNELGHRTFPPGLGRVAGYRKGRRGNRLGLLRRLQVFFHFLEELPQLVLGAGGRDRFAGWRLGLVARLLLAHDLGHNPTDHGNNADDHVHIGCGYG